MFLWEFPTVLWIPFPYLCLNFSLHYPSNLVFVHFVIPHIAVQCLTPGSTAAFDRWPQQGPFLSWAHTASCLIFTGLKRPGRETLPSLRIRIVVLQLATSLLQYCCILRTGPARPYCRFETYGLWRRVLFDGAACLRREGPSKVAACSEFCVISLSYVGGSWNQGACIDTASGQLPGQTKQNGAHLAK